VGFIVFSWVLLYLAWFFCVLGPWCCGFFFGLALVIPVYTSCVPRGALRFFIKVLLIKTKRVLKLACFLVSSFFLFSSSKGS
jgi:hypothetical protein